LASFEAKIVHLQQALEGQDAQALILAVHQLAGSSGSYGFDSIAELCSEIETLVDTDSIEPQTKNSIEPQTKNKTHQLIMLMTAEIK